MSSTRKTMSSSEKVRPDSDVDPYEYSMILFIIVFNFLSIVLLPQLLVGSPSDHMHKTSSLMEYLGEGTIFWTTIAVELGKYWKLRVGCFLAIVTATILAHIRNWRLRCFVDHLSLWTGLTAIVAFVLGLLPYVT